MGIITELMNYKQKSPIGKRILHWEEGTIPTEMYDENFTIQQDLLGCLDLVLKWGEDSPKYQELLPIVNMNDEACHLFIMLCSFYHWTNTAPLNIRVKKRSAAKVEDLQELLRTRVHIIAGPEFLPTKGFQIDFYLELCKNLRQY